MVNISSLTPIESLIGSTSRAQGLEKVERKNECYSSISKNWVGVRMVMPGRILRRVDVDLRR